VVGVNSFGFGGVNAHVILASETGNPPPIARFPSPYSLVGISGPSQTALLESLKNWPYTNHHLEHLHRIHRHNVSGHDWRGYQLVDNKTKSIIEEGVYNAPGSARRGGGGVWYIFSGMGSQCPTLLSCLSSLSPIADSLMRMMVAIKEKFQIDLNLNVWIEGSMNKELTQAEIFASTVATQVSGLKSRQHCQILQNLP